MKGRSLRDTPVLAEELGGEVAARGRRRGPHRMAVVGSAVTEAPGADGDGN